MKFHFTEGNIRMVNKDVKRCLNSVSTRKYTNLNHCGISPQYTCCAVCLVTQLCLTLSNPLDYSPPGSTVHELLQARILEWIVFPFSRESSQSRDQNCLLHCRWILYCLSHHGSPYTYQKN